MNARLHMRRAEDNTSLSISLTQIPQCNAAMNCLRCQARGLFQEYDENSSLDLPFSPSAL